MAGTEAGLLRAAEPAPQTSTGLTTPLAPAGTTPRTAARIAGGGYVALFIFDTVVAVPAVVAEGWFGLWLLLRADRPLPHSGR